MSSSPAILSYGRPRRRLARVPLLFRARDCEDEDGIFALSYGKRVGLVHTRSGATGLATMADEDGMLLRVPSDWPRLSWEMTNAGARARVLLGENGRTNLDLHTGDFANAAWSKTRASITSNVEVAPDGTLTGDRLVEDATASNSHFVGPNTPRTITADAVVTAVRFFKVGTRGWARLYVSGAASVNSFSRYLNLTTGALGTSTEAGTGTHIVSRVELWTAPDGGQWWRLAVTGTIGSGETSVSDLAILTPADNTPVHSGDGASYIGLWGAQFVQGYDTSYIPAGASATTRAADSAYFPLLTAPQAGTLYLRGIAQHRFADATARLLHIGSVAGTTAPSFSLASQALANSVLAQYRDGGSNPTSSLTPSAAILRGDVVEMRGLVSDTWEAQIAASVNGADEVLGAASAAGVSSSAWSATRVYLTGGLTVNSGMFGYDSFAYYLGTHELDELRELVEVA